MSDVSIFGQNVFIELNKEISSLFFTLRNIFHTAFIQRNIRSKSTIKIFEKNLIFETRFESIGHFDILSSFRIEHICKLILKHTSVFFSNPVSLL